MDQQNTDQWEGFLEPSDKPEPSSEPTKTTEVAPTSNPDSEIAPPQDPDGKPFKTVCGGQALIEGIMMRGPTKQAVVVRKPEGDLEIQEKPLTLIKERNKLFGLPFIRGPINFFDAMVNGMKALMFSAEFYPEDEDMEPSKFDLWLEKKLGTQGMNTFISFVAVGISIALSIVLFLFLPTFLGGFVTRFTDSQMVRNIAESVFKMSIFMGYLALCSKMKDIQRVFQYHGAEHKTIFCYEAGLPLTVENVRKQPRFHPRCGTSFLFFVIVISILISTAVFTLYPMDNVFLRMLANFAMLPFVVGISYEFNRYMGRHDNKFCRFLIAPGLWLQKFTTFEPEDDMIEVGIEALKLVLPEEKGADRW
ncbi:MAG: DUF1385 domain-containing protein [Eubacteriales bacterium]